ncbi:hypothetical protein Tco_1103876 [Tanacetum coccineum]
MKSAMYKLKHLKYDIREWNKHNMVSRKNMKTQYKKNLEAVDQILDSGQGVEEDIRVRSEIIHKLQNCDEIIRHWNWLKRQNQMGYEVDENLLNFFTALSTKNHDMRATLTMEFPNRLHPDQSRDLEMSVSNEEIKKAVWECGTDKAPGPDGFTFGFFRHFWYIVEKDVCNAESSFLMEDEDVSVEEDFLLRNRLPRGGIENAQFAEFSVLLQQEDNKTINMLTGRGTLPIDSFCPIKFNITRLKSYTESLASSLRYISTGLWEMPDMRLIRSYVEGPGLVLPFDGS